MATPDDAPTAPRARRKEPVDDPVGHKADSLRQREDAERLMRDLLRHYGAQRRALEAIVAQPREWNILVRYGMDVILNIRWYEREIPRLRQFRARMTALTVLVGLALVVLPAVAAWRLGDTPANQGVIGAQVGLVLSTLVGAWRLILTATDTSARIGIFWQASSDLKELHFSLGDKWRGRLGDEIPGDLVADVAERLRRAREIIRAERLAFFATFRASGALLDTASYGRDQAARALVEARAEASERGHDRASWTIEDATRARDAAARAAAAKKDALEEARRQLGAEDPAVARASAAYADVLVASIEAESLLQQIRAKAGPGDG
jgi:hypothetical protein